MTNKIKNIIIIIILMTQTLSCQDKTIKNENHFQIKGKDIFYNNQKVYLGMPIDEFAKIVNSEYRVAKYSEQGYKNIYYYWISKKLHVSQLDGYVVVQNLAIDEAFGNYYGSSENNEIEDPKYKNIEEVIKKYGKYDSVKVDEIPNRESTFYVFDRLGFNVSVKRNTVSQINLYPIHFIKTYLEPILSNIPGTPPKSLSEKEKEKYRETDDKLDVENYKVILERQPKEEFKGKFTYDGNTADFSKIGYTDWDKMVSDLHIGSSDYDPAGDSKSWSREIREDFDSCLIDIYRYSNKQESGFDRPTEKAVGKIDGVQSIQIYRFTDEEKKK